MKRVSFMNARASKRAGIFLDCQIVSPAGGISIENACFMISLIKRQSLAISMHDFDALLPGGSYENIALVCCMTEIG